ncbi:MAG: large-conductance mechanosensitive channel [Bacteroidia bacterium]|nr:MAG: large-conductance mechanosensitive channel [Bacteroidia bacterium]
MSAFIKEFKEFKEFISKGNVLDLAVGVIIGGAFGKIVNSLVADILTPPLGLLIGGVKFTELKLTLKQAVMDGEKVISEAVTINYGAFLQHVFDFLIIAFAIFNLIRFINALRKRLEKQKQEEEQAPTSEPTKEEILLTEIRDLLKNR